MLIRLVIPVTERRNCLIDVIASPGSDVVVQIISDRFTISGWKFLASAFIDSAMHGYSAYGMCSSLITSGACRRNRSS